MTDAELDEMESRCPSIDVSPDELLALIAEVRSLLALERAALTWMILRQTRVRPAGVDEAAYASTVDAMLIAAIEQRRPLPGG